MFLFTSTKDIQLPRNTDAMIQNKAKVNNDSCSTSLKRQGQTDYAYYKEYVLRICVNCDSQQH